MPRQQTNKYSRSRHSPPPRASTSKPTSKPRRSSRIAPRKQPNRPSTPDVSDTESESDVRDIRSSPPKSSIRERARAVAGGAQDSDPSIESVSPKPTKTRGAAQRLNKQRVPPTPPSKEGSDDSQPIVVHPPKCKARKRVVGSGSDVEEEPQKRRKLVGGKQNTPSPDVEDELDPSCIMEQRLRTPKKPLAMSRIEALKRRRRGSPLSEPTDTAASNEEDTDEGHSDDGEQSGEEGRDTTPRDGRSDDTKDDGFIVQDDENERVELPAEFSISSHQEHHVNFQLVCQRFVHLALLGPADRPEFIERCKHDTYFSIPIEAMRRKISSIRDSAVGSSVWRPNFTAALREYPIFELKKLEKPIPGCDACNMGGKVSTFLAITTGEKYDRNTFEALEEDEEEEGEEGGTDEEEEGKTQDEGTEEEEEEESQEGQDAVPTSEFQIASFCADRAGVYHSLAHWEYFLFDTLRSEVEILQDLEQVVDGGDAPVTAPGDWDVEPPEDPGDPYQIVEWLRKRGFLQAEWSKIDKLMEDSQRLDSRLRNEFFNSNGVGK